MVLITRLHRSFHMYVNVKMFMPLLTRPNITIDKNKRQTGFLTNILNTHTSAPVKPELDELFAYDHWAHHVTPVTSASP